ncbi:hypothetical protein SELMODRAFT_431113 [Selaginella moellendorffii]|uniref:Uncharacterized protein n=1 Tax=Selaginella moellendorffii TaxID=88036 RepID=D8TBK0_SELML|nr:hypothetical protein SELMODRAFT_431113 [Selaginella moellendorffii]
MDGIQGRASVAVVGDLGDEEPFEFFMKGLTPPWEYYCPGIKDYIRDTQLRWQEDATAGQGSRQAFSTACLMVNGADMKERSREVEAEMKQMWNPFTVSLSSALYNEMAAHTLGKRPALGGPTDVLWLRSSPCGRRKECLQLLEMITAGRSLKREYRSKLSKGHNFLQYRDIGEWGEYITSRESSFP